MNDKIVDFLMDKTDQFGNVINELAKQMGVAARHIYEVIVKQQYVEGVAGLIGCLFGVLIGVFLVVVATKSRLYWQARRDKGELRYIDVDDIFITRWIATVLGFAAVVVGLLLSMHFLMMLLNPEYYALQDIMQMIRGELSK